MNSRLIPKILAAVSPEITLEQFRMASGIASNSVIKDVVNFLASNNIGILKSKKIFFHDSDRLKIAILGIQMGCDIEQISSEISWKDFEALGSEMLVSMGYRTKKNLRLRRPTMEIDLVGVNSRYAIAVDCKHWEQNNLGSISMYARKQIERVKVLMERKESIDLTSKLDYTVPAIMTLHAERTKMIEGVPVIPVSQFRSFVSELPEYVSSVRTISA